MMQRMVARKLALLPFVVAAIWLSVAGPAAASPTCRVLDAELQSEYTGGCLNGLAHGQGVARGAEGAWYRGGFEHGRKSGYGVKLYPNGDGYAGEWLNDMRHGQGRYEYGERSPWRGDVYQGGWHNDRHHGEGTYIFFPSGDRFTAQWDNGQTEDIATTTVTRRKQALEVLAPVLGKVGQPVCSVTTHGSSPKRIAYGRVMDALSDRLLVQIETPQVLAASPDPNLNPRWEVLTEWMLCPTSQP